MSTPTIKTSLTAVLFAIAILLLSSFLLSAGEYGAWQTSRDYDGLDFRVKQVGYNDAAKKWEWHIQFRNRYQKSIHFGHALAETGTVNPTLSHRTTLKAGEEPKRFSDNGTDWKLLKSSENVVVAIGKVRFGNDDTGPYASPQKSVP